MRGLDQEIDRAAAAEAVGDFRGVVEEGGVAFDGGLSLANQPLCFADDFSFEAAAGDAACILTVCGDEQARPGAALAGAFIAHQRDQRCGVPAVPQLADSSAFHHCANAPGMEKFYAFSEKVWMPHSSFLPPQRPLRASAPAEGIAVQGSQPILV
jgi:hypothetical protein